MRVDDAATMAVVLADPALHRFTGGTPATAAELEARYAVQTRGRSADGTETWTNAIVLAGEDLAPVGYVQATTPVSGVPTEIAWVIGVPWQRRGYASRATRMLVDGLVELGVTRILAHIHPEHVASQRIAARLGMAPTDVVVDGEVRWQGAASAR